MADFDVSVVMPLYNKGLFVGRSLSRVLHQSLRAREIIVVDDGSTDQGPATVQFLGRSRVTLLKQLNRGPGAARNAGASAAEGEWLAFLDADDFWQANHLATLASMSFQFPEADVLVSGHDRAMAGDPPQDDVESEVEGTERLFDALRSPLSHPRINSSVIAIRRAAFAAAGGFPDFSPGEDTALWFQLALTHQFAITDRVTATIVRGTGGMMDRQDSAHALGQQLPELFARIDHSLQSCRDSDMYQSIQTYRDALVRRSIGQAIVRGETLVARDLLRSIHGPRTRRDCLIGVLNRVPSPLIRLLFSCRRLSYRRMR